MMSLAKPKYGIRKGKPAMTLAQIWDSATDRRELIRSITFAISKGGNIRRGMNKLKRQIPALIGVDCEQCALVFSSSDKGPVAVKIVEEQGGAFKMQLLTGIVMESPNCNGRYMS
jgi:hypothetical protein